MELLTICLDMDGVIADIVGSLNGEFARRGLVDYDYSNMVILKEDDPIDANPYAVEIYTQGVFWKNMKPFYDAWYSMNKWFGQGHELHIVTSRSSDAAKEWTEPWLDMWEVRYNKVHFVHQCHKHEVAHELGAAIMVDDNPHEILSLKENGIHAFLKRAWYNQDCWDDIHSVGNLFELDKEVIAKWS